MNTWNQVLQWLTSQSLAAYLLRGAAAVLLFTLGYMQLDTSPTLGMAVMVSGLIPLGGCPACWIGGTIGAACAVRPRKAETGLKD